MMVFTNDCSSNLPRLKSQIYPIRASMQNLILDIGIRSILRFLSPERYLNQKLFPDGRVYGYTARKQKRQYQPQKIRQL